MARVLKAFRLLGDHSEQLQRLLDIFLLLNHANGVGATQVVLDGGDVSWDRIHHVLAENHSWSELGDEVEEAPKIVTIVDLVSDANICDGQHML